MWDRLFATIMQITDTGDVYACVHIQHQPALHHPKLKNHIVQVCLSVKPLNKDLGDRSSGIGEVAGSDTGVRESRSAD
ncbi:hypothetical protein Scep_002600 [Stephania cephalantha]|uniref:Neprosin activation peptide domain-containing protein n=1 Tax=Stephania cephalantha TaxID=152367 RepID=A0AAP0Q625_9MAGN